MSKFLNALRKKTGSTSFEDSKYGAPDHFIDTGNYALNRICSGDLTKGIPAGRTILLAGPTGVGKSLIALRIAANALKINEYDQILYFDSEGGAPKEMIMNLGCDPSKVEQIMIDSVEDATVKILSSYEVILNEQENNPDFKALLIVDSLGALVATKIYNDAEKGKQVHDQGNRARLVNALVKGCVVPAIKTNCTILILNHIYEGPEMFPSKIKNQSGGMGIQYMSSLTLQCSKTFEKKTDADDEEFYTGTYLKFFTTKNRLVRPFLETEIFIDFTKGITNPYDGLVDIAIKYGIIDKATTQMYTVPSFSKDKQYKMKALMKNREMWEAILPLLNEKSIEDLKYSKFSDAEKDLLKQTGEEETEDEEKA